MARKKSIYVDYSSMTVPELEAAIAEAKGKIKIENRIIEQVTDELAEKGFVPDNCKGKAYKLHADEDSSETRYIYVRTIEKEKWGNDYNITGVIITHATNELGVLESSNLCVEHGKEETALSADDITSAVEISKEEFFAQVDIVQSSAKELIFLSL